MDVLLVVMPFATVKEPSIGVSILKAAAAEAGFTARTRYFNFDFAELTGFDLYQAVGKSFASRSLVADWVFSEALFGMDAPGEEEYATHLLADYARWEDGIPYGQDFGGGRNFTRFIEQELLPAITDVRRAARQFIEECVAQIVSLAPRVVAFTSSCHMACSTLAAAKLLKGQPSPPVVVFGGANCHGDMGLQWLRSFPFIDYICTGEGDDVFPAFLKQLLCDGDPRPLPGMLRQKESRQLTVPELPRDLDRLPFPDFTDYFDRLERSALKEEIGLPILPLESSRGCWWGEHTQCVFCGNCRHTIPFRSKSPDRVVRELSALGDGERFGFVSWVDDSLDRSHIDTVFPRLKEAAFPLPMFFQTRPNLTRAELQTLFEGGVRVIQPGIESFSDEVLKLMRKGSTGLQNIRLLRWCAEVGMGASWNILYGFAGESEAEYERMAQTLPLLAHLQPPNGCAFIALKRFSPYWESPRENGLTEVSPWPSYRLVYPLPEDELNGFAYFFDFRYADARQPFDYTRSLRREVGRWIILWQRPLRKRPRLVMRQDGEKVVVTDTRPCAVRRRHVLSGLAARLCLFCRTIRGIGDIMREFGEEAGEGKLEKALKRLLSAGIVLRSGERYLSLPLSPDP